MFFVVVSSLCVYLSSHHCLYTYIITLYLLFVHLYLITHINSYHHSIHSIHLKISPDPLLRVLPHLRTLNSPPPPGVGGASVGDDCVACVDD